MAGRPALERVVRTLLGRLSVTKKLKPHQRTGGASIGIIASMGAVFALLSDVLRR